MPGVSPAQVYAPTFPGYGRSEKPVVTYSAELWRDFLRDFVLEVLASIEPSGQISRCLCVKRK